MTSPFDSLPQNAKDLVDCTTRLLMLYMKGTTRIEMMVGLNCKAILSIEGGPITREVIDDTLTHLAFYKKYFPKTDEQNTAALDSPEKIIDAMKAAWAAEHAIAAAQSERKND